MGGFKFNFYDFLGKKIDTADISTVASKELEKLAFKELALHIGISYIANTLSKCEFKVYQNGKEVRDKFYYLLNVSPNDNQNSSQFINQIVETIFYKGEALVVMENDKLYCADSFAVDESKPLKGFIYEGINIGNYQVKGKRKAGEIWHFKLDNKDVKNLIDGLYESYGQIIALALQTYKATNGRKYKLLLENYRAGDPAFAETFENVIKKQLETFINNDNAVYPQFKGTDLQEFASASGRADTNDVIAMRKEIFDTTAQALKIPLTMMYGNITNMKEIVRVFLTFCIEPLADMISEELTRKRHDFDEWSKGCRVEVDTSCINYIDIFDDADKADKAISCGLATIDELRPRVRLNPLKTDFSMAHFMTKNYDLAENILKNMEGKEVKEDEEEAVLLADPNTGEGDN